MAVNRKKAGSGTRNTVKVVDEAAIGVSFMTLVIRVSSIERLWPGGMVRYKQGPAWGVANTRLAVMAEMMSAAPMLDQFIANELISRGFNERKDFVIGSDVLMKGVERRPTPKPTELPWCMDIPWLRSFATNKGWFVEGV